MLRLDGRSGGNFARRGGGKAAVARALRRAGVGLRGAHRRRIPGRLFDRDGRSGGLDAVSDAVVFHAGTRREAGQIVTAGGRVLGVTASGDGIDDARAKVYAAVQQISFQGMHYREDIGGRT